MAIAVNFRILPVISAVSWTVTLATLLIYWLAKGRPRFPSQNESNIAYISDVGGGQLKPLFIVGCCLTSIAFGAVMMQIHLPRLRQCQSQSWLDATSRLLALGSGIGAAASLCLLSILDAQHWRSVHIALMYVFCAGMLLGATCTAVAERTGVVQTMAGTDEKSTDSEHRKRKRKLAIIVLIAIELTLIVVYVVLFSNWFLFTVGILEWIIAFLFAPYLWGMGLYLQEAQCTSTETLIR